MTRAHVLFCVQNLAVPQDTRVWREALALRSAGHDVTVICPRTSGGPRQEVLDGVRVLRFPAAPDLPGLVGQVLETGWSLVCATAMALRLRRRGRIDVLHAANPPDTFFLLGRALRPFGTRFIFDQHDLVPELLVARGGDPASKAGRLFTWLESRSYHAADLVISPNDSYRAVAIQRGGVAPDRAITVRSGPDAVHATGDGPTPERERRARIVFAGVMGPQDGVETLVDAAAIVRARTSLDFVVEMIGRGSEVPRLRERARDLGVADRFVWSGWVDQVTLRERLARATIAVSPDRDDAFTRRSTMTKVAEYLSMGIPSLVADLPETRATAGDAASYFVAGDSTDLAKRLEELMDDEAYRHELAARAVARAPHLLWHHSAARLVAAYSALLDGSAPPTGDQPVGPA